MQEKGQCSIDIVTTVEEPDGMSLTVLEPISWDPDPDELLEARRRAVDAAHQVAEYIRKMPEAARGENALEGSRTRR